MSFVFGWGFFWYFFHFAEKRLIREVKEHEVIISHKLGVASWSSGRHLALGSGDPGIQFWLSLGKALSMYFPHPTHV